MNPELFKSNIETMEAVNTTSMVARKMIANLIADNHMTEKKKTKFVNQKLQDLHNRFYDLQIISESIKKDFEQLNQTK